MTRKKTKIERLLKINFGFQFFILDSWFFLLISNQKTFIRFFQKEKEFISFQFRFFVSNITILVSYTWNSWFLILHYYCCYYLGWKIRIPSIFFSLNFSYSSSKQHYPIHLIFQSHTKHTKHKPYLFYHHQSTKQQTKRPKWWPFIHMMKFFRFRGDQ